MTWIAACSGQRGIYQEKKEMIVDLPELTENERRHITLTALRQAAFDGQKTTLARIHYSHLVRAADEIERLAAENERLKEDAECWRRRND